MDHVIHHLNQDAGMHIFAKGKGAYSARDGTKNFSQELPTKQKLLQDPKVLIQMMTRQEEPRTKEMRNKMYFQSNFLYTGSNGLQKHLHSFNCKYNQIGLKLS